MTRHVPLAVALVVAVFVTGVLCAQSGATDASTITFLAGCGAVWGALAGWLLRRLVPAARTRPSGKNGASK
ncbi:hypothetical protein ACIOJE_35045 [Kitasatospora sp. NPDC087861]|uniref:hypothetical protein n=1 Tax=Kitasatospora sp. NPDC087861 TaxID=3364070 RepID=UPI003802DC4F